MNLAMAEIAEDVREGLLALAVGAGLQVMSAFYGRRRGRVGRPTRQAQR